MVANPGLALAIRQVDSGQSEPALLSWPQVLDLIDAFWHLVVVHLECNQQTGRLKQWLNLMRRVFPQAQEAFMAVKAFHDPADVARWLQKQRGIEKN
jgi:tRNA-dihydrouridine synthase C